MPSLSPSELADYVFQVHHIGGRDGEVGEFPISDAFREFVHFHIYDADPSCLPQVEELNASRGNRFTLHNYIVDDRNGVATFSVNMCPCTSSLLPAAEFKQNQYSPSSLFGDYDYNTTFARRSSFEAPVITIDTLAERESLTVDFLSIDTQGTEDRVLAGSDRHLKTTVVGVVSEVEFHHLYKDQALFGDIHTQMQKAGFNFMRIFTREARVNFFKAGIGFRGDGMLMSGDALFLKDPDILEAEFPNPLHGLVKLAFIALTFGYIEYAIDCLARASQMDGADVVLNAQNTGYLGNLAKLWKLYKEALFIPQPSFKQMFTEEEALKRFEVNARHPWETFDLDRVRRTYFDSIDVAAFRAALPVLAAPDETPVEQLLTEAGFTRASEMAKTQRLKQVGMLIESLKLGRKAGDRYVLKLDRVLNELGYPMSAQNNPPTPDEIRKEVDRLSKASGWEGGPSEGWQYPFDFGHGIIAPTYTDVQATPHPWREKVLLANLDKHFQGQYEKLSVLDLGACEGALAAALWEKGVRDITCVEIRKVNVEKARFAFRTLGMDIPVVEDEIGHFLEHDRRRYDLVLFMGILYHLVDPFSIMKAAGRVTRKVLALETVLAQPGGLRFENKREYSPSPEGFFIRHDLAAGNTARLTDIELWPDMSALDTLVREAGFQEMVECDYGADLIDWYETKQRTMMLCHR